MNFISTRNRAIIKTLSTAIETGLAADGGLFVPETMPIIDKSWFSLELSYPMFASKLLAHFFNGDALATQLDSFCKRAFNFPIPLQQLDDNLFVLELFHGPTSSFKDLGARFLAECLSETANCQKTILVATSGDTGSAVASAFHRKLNYRAVILYPDKQISAMQEQQMTCWDENIFAFAVNGNFDQCQQLVKSAFLDPHWQEAGGLSSANSINIARLLAQMTYYAYSSMQFFKKFKENSGFIIPSGNLGNATAAYWAKAMGFPIREIVLATNANQVLSDYLNNAHYQSQPSIRTLANAMDVGNPSNLERLNHLFDSFELFKKNVSAISVNDDAIRETIQEIYNHYHYISCPHTATAFHVQTKLANKPWIVVATADPFKFHELIEPLLTIKIPISPQLKSLIKSPSIIRRVNANLDDIKKLFSLEQN
ncbi:MAG: threonine synthase [Tatlockia sp.]|nr:threonine synthase [Tatlockia sp.]